MFRKSLNELVVRFRIEGRSPLFIKDGRYKKERQEEPDAIFMSATVADAKNQITWTARKRAADDLMYVPGSSLKGAWRSYLEKTLRSLDNAPKVCDPLLGESESGQPPDQSAPGLKTGYESCSSRLGTKQKVRSEHPYRDSCPVCRLFGNTVQGSRITISDASWESGISVMAENNAISRQTGAAISPFKTMVVRNAVFKGCLRLRNFELWQVGLLALFFDELGAERVPLGAGKNKGWGRTCVRATSIELCYFGPQKQFEDGRLLGIGELLSESERRRYGLQITPPEDLPVVSGRKDDASSSLWRTAWYISGEEISAFWTACRACFNHSSWNSLPFLPKPSQQDGEAEKPGMHA